MTTSNHQWSALVLVVENGSQDCFRIAVDILNCQRENDYQYISNSMHIVIIIIIIISLLSG